MSNLVSMKTRLLRCYLLKRLRLSSSCVCFPAPGDPEEEMLCKACPEQGAHEHGNQAPHMETVELVLLITNYNQ